MLRVDLCMTLLMHYMRINIIIMDFNVENQYDM